MASKFPLTESELAQLDRENKALFSYLEQSSTTPQPIKKIESPQSTKENASDYMSIITAIRAKGVAQMTTQDLEALEAAIKPIAQAKAALENNPELIELQSLKIRLSQQQALVAELTKETDKLRTELATEKEKLLSKNAEAESNSIIDKQAGHNQLFYGLS